MKIQTLLKEELNNNERTLVLVGETRDSVKGALHIQVESANNLTLTVKGRVSQTTDDEEVAVVDMAQFKKSSTINEDGIYWVLTEQFYSVTFVATGSCVITVKAVE